MSKNSKRDKRSKSKEESYCLTSDDDSLSNTLSLAPRPRVQIFPDVADRLRPRSSLIERNFQEEAPANPVRQQLFQVHDRQRLRKSIIDRNFNDFVSSTPINSAQKTFNKCLAISPIENKYPKEIQAKEVSNSTAEVIKSVAGPSRSHRYKGKVDAASGATTESSIHDPVEKSHESDAIDVSKKRGKITLRSIHVQTDFRPDDQTDGDDDSNHESEVTFANAATSTTSRSGSDSEESEITEAALKEMDDWLESLFEIHLLPSSSLNEAEEVSSPTLYKEVELKEVVVRLERLRIVPKTPVKNDVVEQDLTSEQTSIKPSIAEDAVDTRRNKKRKKPQKGNNQIIPEICLENVVGHDITSEQTFDNFHNNYPGAEDVGLRSDAVETSKRVRSTPVRRATKVLNRTENTSGDLSHSKKKLDNSTNKKCVSEMSSNPAIDVNRDLNDGNTKRKGRVSRPAKIVIIANQLLDGTRDAPLTDYLPPASNVSDAVATAGSATIRHNGRNVPGTSSTVEPSSIGNKRQKRSRIETPESTPDTEIEGLRRSKRQRGAPPQRCTSTVLLTTNPQALGKNFKYCDISQCKWLTLPASMSKATTNRSNKKSRVTKPKPPAKSKKATTSPSTKKSMEMTGVRELSASSSIGASNIPSTSSVRSQLSCVVEENNFVERTIIERQEEEEHEEQLPAPSHDYISRRHFYYPQDNKVRKVGKRKKT